MKSIHPAIIERLNKQEALLARANRPDPRWDNGWYERFSQPVLTKDHVPVSWRYDFDASANPFGMERLAAGAVFNASCDTALHVARTTVDRLVDYALQTPEDPLQTGLCARQRRDLWEKNQGFVRE